MHSKLRKLISFQWKCRSQRHFRGRDKNSIANEVKGTTASYLCRTLCRLVKIKRKVSKI